MDAVQSQGLADGRGSMAAFEGSMADEVALRESLAALINDHNEIAAPAADVITWAIMDAPHPARG